MPSGMFVVFPAWGSMCESVRASKHSSMHLSTPRASFYKSAISLTLGKHSSALPKPDGPIDLNY